MRDAASPRGPRSEGGEPVGWGRRQGSPSAWGSSGGPDRGLERRRPGRPGGSGRSRGCEPPAWRTRVRLASGPARASGPAAALLAPLLRPRAPSPFPAQPRTRLSSPAIMVDSAAWRCWIASGAAPPLLEASKRTACCQTDLDEAFRRRVEALLATWRSQLAEDLHRAQREGRFRAELCPAETAAIRVAAPRGLRRHRQAHPRPEGAAASRGRLRRVPSLPPTLERRSSMKSARGPAGLGGDGRPTPLERVAAGQTPAPVAVELDASVASRRQAPLRRCAMTGSTRAASRASNRGGGHHGHMLSASSQEDRQSAEG